MMTAREYMERCRFVDKQIEARLRQADKLNDLLLRTTSVITGIRSGSGPDITGRECALAEAADLRQELSNEINDLICIKRDIYGIISRLEKRDQQVLLELRYLDMCTWEEIAGNMGISVRAVHYLHKKALAEVERLMAS